MGTGRSQRFGPVEHRRVSLAVVVAAALVAPIAVAYPAAVPWRPAAAFVLVSAAEAKVPPVPAALPIALPELLPPVADPSAADVPDSTIPRVESCRDVAEPDPSDRTAVARMVSQVFRCVASASGLGAVAPASLESGRHRWDGAARWGFRSLADQVAAEAVVVGYCESGGFDPWVLGHDNRYGYGGVFQMGDREWADHAAPGSSKFEPVANVWAAARYFVASRAAGDPWGGWGPWAVVNTDYGGPNAGVRVPALPRFVSTDARYRGTPGPELPAWAVDPWSQEVPPWKGCPISREGMSW